MIGRLISSIQYKTTSFFLFSNIMAWVPGCLESSGRLGPGRAFLKKEEVESSSEDSVIDLVSSDDSADDVDDKVRITNDEESADEESDKSADDDDENESGDEGRIEALMKEPKRRRL